MAAYLRSIRKGLLIAAAILCVDVAVSTLMTFIGFSLLGLVGDLLLVEAGLLAVAGGLVEFSRSKGVYEFHRVLLQAKEQFSTTRHGEASRTAVVLFSAAMTLFSFLILLVLFE